jgi:two-component system cell cycle sensor histidine kinase/response regulator CckA
MVTVLVVDDDRPVRELAARMLQEAGYDTIQAIDGQDAWRQLRRATGKVEAVVSDVVMPNMTGTELLARVQADFPRLPVVLMSGYSADDLRARGLEQYPVPLLTKPFQQDELVAAVNRILRVESRSAAS